MSLAEGLRKLTIGNLKIRVERPIKLASDKYISILQMELDTLRTISRRNGTAETQKLCTLSCATIKNGANSTATISHLFIRVGVARLVGRLGHCQT